MIKAIQTSLSGLLAADAQANKAANRILNSVAQASNNVSRATSSFAASTATPKPVPNENKEKGSGNPLNTTSSPSSSAFLSLQSTNEFVEIGELKRASTAYKANAQVLKTLDDTTKSFLDSI